MKGRERQMFLNTIFIKRLWFQLINWLAKGVNLNEVKWRDIAGMCPIQRSLIHLTNEQRALVRADGVTLDQLDNGLFVEGTLMVAKGKGYLLFTHPGFWDNGCLEILEVGGIDRLPKDFGVFFKQ